MYRSTLTPGLLFAALCVGCTGGSPASDSRAVFIVVKGPIAQGAYGSAQLVNRSGSAIHIGAIGCGVRTDRQVSDHWSELPPVSNYCVQPVYTVEDGGSYPFTFAAPTSAGTYRLRTFVGGDSVFSAPFTVP